METATENLSNINHEIKGLIDRIIEIEEYNANDDFDTRESSICANIKVYECLDEDNVLDFIKKSNLNNYKDEILEEFNEERLNSICNHTAEYEVEYLKEKYESNCDVSNPYKAFHLYQRFLESDFKAWPIDKYTVQDKQGNVIRQGYHLNSWKHNEFIEFSKRKKNSLEDYKKDYIKRNKWEYEEFERRSLINFNCWQYGRSGGWFSICENNEIENQECDYSDMIGYLEGVYDNKEFNEILNDYDWDYRSKKTLIKELQSFIDDWEEKFEAIQYYINEIEENKKYYKESLLDRLENEITRFIDEDLEAEYSNCKINIEGDLIKTTMGVTVNLQEFKTAFNSVKDKFKSLAVGDKTPIKIRVGNYFVEYAKKVENDILIKAGCHRFSLNNINEILTT